MNPPDAMLEHRIRQRAYEIYHARLENPALYNWLQAEHEILKETKQFASGVTQNRPMRVT